MTTSLPKSQLKQSNILKKIIIESNVDERQEVMVCCETAPRKWKDLNIAWRYGIKCMNGFDV
jgi:hypothetical protein